MTWREHDIVLPSSEDGGLGSVSEYFASLTVDSVTLPNDVLIPARPTSTSLLYIGGLGCATSGARAYTRSLLRST
jgi:hypothetical protein